MKAIDQIMEYITVENEKKNPISTLLVVDNLEYRVSISTRNGYRIWQIHVDSDIDKNDFGKQVIKNKFINLPFSISIIYYMSERHEVEIEFEECIFQYNEPLFKYNTKVKFTNCVFNGYEKQLGWI